MSKRDFYDILGLGRDASTDELKRAFRRAALKFHPDRNPGDKEAEARFKEMAEAYEVLGNPETRARYDQFGHAGLRGQPHHDFTGFEDIFSHFADIFGGGIFGDFFGGAGAARRTGNHRRVNIELSFEEAAAGVDQTIEIDRNEYCRECRGTGVRGGAAPAACPYCKGYGEVEHRRGFFVMRQTCPNCRGTGRVNTDPCPVCNGSGHRPQHVRVQISIPPGVAHGQRLVVGGEGDPGENGAPRGNLYCDIRLKPHPFFDREANDVLCEVPVSFTQAALGTEIDVPTLQGKARVRVPRGTQSGRVFRLNGQGFPDVNGRGRGNERVRVVIETPRNLTREQEDLLRKFAETEDANVTPRRKSFFDKVKQYFHEVT